MGLLIKYGVGTSHEFGMEFDDSDLPPRQEALAQLTRQVAGVHGLAKRVPSETVASALKNEPFEDYPRAVYGYKRAYGEGGKAKDRFDQSYAKSVEGFLRQTYNSLTFIPEISFDIGNISEKNERRALNAAIARYRTSNMGGQIASLEEAYNGLGALRTVFRHVRKYSDLSIETVVPSRYLPELLMAAPVWFIEPKKPFWSIDLLEKWRDKGKEKASGSQSEIVRYFCNLGGTDRFAHLFQLYNRTPRNFIEFTGRDVMPLPIIELVRQVRHVFDYLALPLALPLGGCLFQKSFGVLGWAYKHIMYFFYSCLIKI